MQHLVSIDVDNFEPPESDNGRHIANKKRGGWRRRAPFVSTSSDKTLEEFCRSIDVNVQTSDLSDK